MPTVIVACTHRNRKEAENKSSVCTSAHSVCRVDLAQQVRFLVVELTHPGLNPRFNMGVVFTANYLFSWM
jgi:hypothetical protein